MLWQQYLSESCIRAVLVALEEEGVGGRTFHPQRTAAV